jgi:O-antigen biosynthesis protein
VNRERVQDGAQVVKASRSGYYNWKDRTKRESRHFMHSIVNKSLDSYRASAYIMRYTKDENPFLAGVREGNPTACKQEVEVSLDSVDSSILSHSLLVELTGRNKRVLVGASAGHLAKTLVEQGCEVVGVGIDPEAAEEAEAHTERVIMGDLESVDLEAELGKGSFDVILLEDVLDRVRDPLQTLKRVMPLLRSQEGYVVASVLNAAHGSVRLALLQGDFRYRPSRYLARASVEQLFDEAGYATGTLERVKLGIFDAEIEVDAERVPAEVLDLICADPEAETYQFVLAAYPHGSKPAAVELLHRVRLLEKDLIERDRVIHDLTRRLRNLSELHRRLEKGEKQLVAARDETSKVSQELARRNHQLARLERTVNRLKRLGRAAR